MSVEGPVLWEVIFLKSQTQVQSVIKDLDKSFAMVVVHVSIKSHRSDIVNATAPPRVSSDRTICNQITGFCRRSMYQTKQSQINTTSVKANYTGESNNRSIQV